MPQGNARRESSVSQGYARTVNVLGTKIVVTQNSHGFSTGQAVYFNGTSWGLAIANDGSKLGIGVIIVLDTNTFELYLASQIVGLSGLIAGQYYFVSDATPGALSTTEPVSASSFSNPILLAISSTIGIVLPYRPSQIATQATTPGSNVVTVSANYTAQAGQIVLVNTTSSGVTISLPTAIGNDGLEIYIKKISADSNNITIDPYLTQTIDGQSNLIFNTQYTSVGLVSDNSNWYII